MSLGSDSGLSLIANPAKTGTKMAFTLPVFNLEFWVWRTPDVPLIDPPDEGPFPGQVYVQSRPPITVDQPPLDFGNPPILIRFPMGAFTPRAGDIYALDAGGTACYQLLWYHPMHLGFTNEYGAILVRMVSRGGTVIEISPL